MDVHNFKERLAKSVDTILNSEDFFDNDRKDLRDFYHYLVANNRNAGRIIKYLYHLKTMSRMQGKPFKTMNKTDIVELMAKVNSGRLKTGKEWSENTKRDFRVVFKKYYQWLKGLSGSEYPQEVKWIQTWIKNKITKKPEDILTQEEILKLAEATGNIRDKAFILAIGESGLRIGEFLPLKIQNLEFDQEGCLIKIISEKSLRPRTVRIVGSAPTLSQWLNMHPYKNNSEAFVWINPNSDGSSHLAYGFVLRTLKELGKKVGIIKKVNNHAFRHASATFKAKFLPEALLRQYYGWSRNSDMANFYVHISAKDLDDSIVKMHKANGLQDKPIINIKECFKCKEKNDIISKYCKRCSFPLDEKILFQMDKVEELLIEYFKTLGELYPPAKPKLMELAKAKGLESLFSDGK